MIDYKYYNNNIRWKQWVMMQTGASCGEAGGRPLRAAECGGNGAERLGCNACAGLYAPLP